MQTVIGKFKATANEIEQIKLNKWRQQLTQDNLQVALQSYLHLTKLFFKMDNRQAVAVFC